jgi:tetratricopeptide (TPR) repeat protein
MRYLLFIALTSLIMSLLAQPNPVIQQFEAERIYAKGLTLYEQGAYQDAITLFNRVVEINGEHEGVYEFRAEAYYQLGNYRAAINDYERALRQDPDNVELLNSAGVSAGQMAMYNAAIRYFDRALKLNPAHQEAQHNRAEALRRQGQMALVNQPGGRQNPNDPFAPGFQGGGNGSAPTIIDLKAFSLTRSNEAVSTVGSPREERFEQKKTEDQIYSKQRISVRKSSDPYVTIERIVIRKNETEVGLKVKNIAGEIYPLLLGKKGSEEAFFLTNLGLDRIYELREVRNLPSWKSGSPTDLQPGQETYLVLIFRRLDDDIRSFHLIEGKEPRPGTWNFWQVSLDD